MKSYKELKVFFRAVKKHLWNLKHSLVCHTGLGYCTTYLSTVKCFESL